MTQITSITSPLITVKNTMQWKLQMIREHCISTFTLPSWLHRWSQWDSSSSKLASTSLTTRIASLLWQIFSSSSVCFGWITKQNRRIQIFGIPGMMSLMIIQRITIWSSRYSIVSWRDLPYTIKWRSRKRVKRFAPGKSHSLSWRSSGYWLLSLQIFNLSSTAKQSYTSAASILN